MKKFLSATILTLLSISMLSAATFPANLRKWKGFTEDEQKQIQELLQKKSNLGWFNMYILAAKVEQEAKTNPKIYTNINEFLSLINKVKKENNLTNPKTGYLQIVVGNKNFSDELIVELAKMEIDVPFTIANFCYLKESIQDKIFPNKKDYVTKAASMKYYSPNWLNKTLTYIENVMIDMNPEEVLGVLPLLKKLKVIHYKNIALSDDWKKALVRLELMIKSLE